MNKIKGGNHTYLIIPTSALPASGYEGYHLSKSETEKHPLTSHFGKSPAKVRYFVETTK